MTVDTGKPDGDCLSQGRAPVWPADWWREGLIRPDRYVAMRELLCPMCGKTGHVAGDCGRGEH